jgi:RND family efflux transporter MFP subunit
MLLLAALPAFLAARHVFAAQDDGKAALGETKTEANASTEKKASTPTTKIQSIEQESVLRLTGTIEADEKSDVASSANGIIEKVFIERGSVVEKGATLIQVDPIDMQNMLDEGLAGVQELKVRLGLTDSKEPYNVENQPEVKMAKSALELADVNFKRFQNLYDQGALSKAEYDRMRCEYNSAEQRYEQAKYQMRQLYQSYLTAQTRLKMLRKALADTTVTAPFSGYVTERYVNVGERVTTNPMGQGSKIITMVKLDPLRLALTVPQQNADEVKPGMTVSFKVDSLPDRVFTGVIKYVAPSVESVSRSMKVEAIVENPERLLRPGAFVSAEVSLPNKAQHFFVPSSSILRQGDITKVFVVRDGVAREQVVSFRVAQEDLIELTSGIKADDVIVLTPEQIHDGDKVQ